VFQFLYKFSCARLEFRRENSAREDEY